MKPWTRFALVLLTGIGAPESALAEPVVRLSWNQCDPIVPTLDWAGHGLYRAILGATNLDSTVLGYRVRFRVYGVPDAWRFDSGGCQAGRFSVEFASSDPPCPVLLGANPTSLSFVEYDPVTDGISFEVLSAFDPFVPDSDTWYTVAGMVFDHGRSACGPQDPAIACGLADTPMTFMISMCEWLYPPPHLVPCGSWESWELSWNEEGDCPTVQALESSWGRVKALYR